MARFLHRVRLENNKSIARCDVELQDLTFLVGPNGAGKSNFLYAIHVAMKAFSLIKSKKMEILFDISEDINANSSIKIDKNRLSSYFKTKNFEISVKMQRNKEAVFEIFEEKSDEVINNLIKYHDYIDFDVYEPKENSNDRDLHSDFSNILRIMYLIQEDNKEIYEKINKYLRKISLSIDRFWIINAGGYYIIQFSCFGGSTPITPSQVSSGTLRALSVLVAIFYARILNYKILCIEEPESGLHPAAARVIYGALKEVSEHVQIIATSHSPDLLDDPEISPENILSVVYENGETKIGPINEASRRALNEHIFTAGELLRLNQLEPAA